MIKPNIVFITLHDLGDYLGCYGTPIDTPNIDSIAKNGILFENHMSAAPICSPARGAMVTGCYPHTNRLMGLVHRGWALDTEKCKPLPQILSENGYQTCLFGFQHEHYNPAVLGYQNIFDNGNRHCEYVIPGFVDWLENRKNDTPFYAAIGFQEVHRMGLKPSGFKMEGYLPVSPSDVEVREYLPDIPLIRNDLADFYGAIRYTDFWVGKVLECLKRTNHMDDTIIIFTTDHGASFIHSKATLYEGGVKVALLMQYNGMMPKGQRYQGLSGQVDILPTLLDILDIESPDVEGISLRNSLLGHTAPERNYSFSEENYNNHFMPTRAVRSKKYRYIKYGFPVCVLDFLIPEIELNTSHYRLDPDVAKHYSAIRHDEELFDLECDPGEKCNLVNNPAFEQTLLEHRTVLAEHMERTGDPFANFFHGGLIMPKEAYEMVRNYKK